MLLDEEMVAEQLNNVKIHPMPSHQKTGQEVHSVATGQVKAPVFILFRILPQLGNY
jgi:hypothetical protein